MDVLAGVLEDQGRYEEAEKVLREALTASDRKDRELTLTTARLQHNLGWMLWKRGEYAEAEPLLRAGVANLPDMRPGASLHGSPSRTSRAI